MIAAMRARAASAVALVLLALVALIVVLVVRGGGASRPPPPFPPQVTGFPTIVQDDGQMLHTDPANIASDVRTLRGLGVDWVRITAGWSVIAPDPTATRRPSFDATDPAAYPSGAWDELDRAVRMTAAAGMKPEIDIAFWAPRWATSRTVAPADRQRWGIDARDYGQFARAVARRYSGHYRGLPAAVAFTVWNEPNYGVFLLPQRRLEQGRWAIASADEYRAMLDAAAPAIRAEAPRALLLIGATAGTGDPTPDGPGSGVAPLDFLRALACVDAGGRPIDTGACRDFKPLPGDGWSHHPYTPNGPPTQPDPRPGSVELVGLPKLAQLLDRLHAAGRTQRQMPIYVTEYGYETDPPDPTQRFTPADQARFLPAAELIARASPSVRSWAQFELRDLGPLAGATPHERWRLFQTGLEFPDGRRKPAFAGFRLPLVVARTGTGGVRLAGRVRPGSGRRRFRIDARASDGTWHPAAPRASTGPDGFFVLDLPGRPAAAYRVAIPQGSGWSAGPAIAPAR